MPDLFISSAGRDQALARYLTAELARAGASVYSHTPDQSAAYLLLLSPAGRDSLRVQTHIAQALAAGKKFAALIIESPPLLATGAVDRLLRFWDVETGALLASPEAHGAAIIALAFAPDGATLATGSSDRSIILWQLG